MKSPLWVGLGLVLAGLACNPEHSLTDVLEHKDCSKDGQCVDGYECDKPSNTCVLKLAPLPAGGSAGSVSDELSQAGGSGSTEPDPVSDPAVGGEGGDGGAAGAAAAAAGAGGVGSNDPVVGDADAGCTKVTLHKDRDGDLFGSDAPEDTIFDCPQPGFVEAGGDCLDADVTADNKANQVHPGQTAFFAVGYVPQPGVVSFDYDCSLREEPDTVNNSKLGAFADCSAGNPTTACSDAFGIVPDDRSGSNINSLCGSTSLQTCTAQAGQCVLGGRVENRDPFVCH